MRDKVRIDDICRTERYYTATLLPYILFHESFAGLRAFLRMLADKQICALDAETYAPVALNCGGPLANVELITEVGLVRDAKFYSSWIDGLEDIELKDAEELRPDLVIIADDLLVVLEAKFFLDSISQTQIRKQLLNQREAIRKVYLRFPGYGFRQYCHLFLSAKPPVSAEAIGCQGVLSWDDIRHLAEQVLGKEHYVTERLTRALEWYGHTTDKQGTDGSNYRGKESLQEILRMCEQKGNAVQISFTGGARAMETARPERLRTRRFKWDWTENPIGRKERCNWITGVGFLDVIRKRLPELLP
jgi:hypothetical protein